MAELLVHVLLFFILFFFIESMADVPHAFKALTLVANITNSELVTLPS